MIIILSFYGCTKDKSEIPKFATGTYSGVKILYYLYSHHESADTITIKFDSYTYSYSGSDALDFGRGNYLIKSNTVEFTDEEARNALYTWEWILGGTHKFKISGDSLILNQNGTYIQVSCRLINITK